MSSRTSKDLTTTKRSFFNLGHVRLDCLSQRGGDQLRPLGLHARCLLRSTGSGIVAVLLVLLAVVALVVIAPIAALVHDPLGEDAFVAYLSVKLMLKDLLVS
jgi:hypothetical protein